MRILLEAHHPAHIHFWKYPVRELINRGHEVLMIGRDRDVMKCLFEVYDWITAEIPPRKTRKNTFPLIEMLERQWAVAKAIRRFKPDVVASLMGSYTQSAKLFGVRNMIFTDSEFQHFNHRIAHPFADEIHTPECFYKKLGKKQRHYNSIHEFAFLDPQYFRPNDKVVESYGLIAGRYVVVRLSAWNTLHDVKQQGVGDLIYSFVEKHKEYSRIVLVAEEGDVPPGLEKYTIQIAPEDFHCILAFARFVLSEGASTASEATCLGAPTVYINSTEPRGYLQMLESKCDGLQCFRDPSLGMSTAEEFLSRIEVGDEFALSARAAFREELCAIHLNLVDYIVEVVESQLR